MCNTVHEVIDVLFDQFVPRWVRLPTQAEAVQLANDTHTLSGFPNIAPLRVDGTYVKVSAPKHLKRACFNRKKFHSLNVMCVTGKVLSLLEACFDLIMGSSLSMKIQIMGRKVTENLGFKSSLWKVNFFLSFFFSFSNSSHKEGNFYFSHFLISCLIN